MKYATKVGLSLLLVACMLISGTPIVSPVVATNYYAAEGDPSTKTLPTEAMEFSEDFINEEVSIVEEETALRGEYEKHFLMSDGSYQVAVYNEPVHKLENGKWVEVDNTLTLLTSSNGIERYSTKNGLATVSFAKAINNKLVTMQQEEYSVSWGVQAIPNTNIVANSAASLVTNLSKPIVVDPIEAEPVATDLSAYSAEEQKMVAVKSSSAIQYSNALGTDIDLEYIVLPSRVKDAVKGTADDLVNGSASKKMDEPVIRFAYLQVGNEVKPVWVCSSDGFYGNHIFIEMNTGEHLLIS